MANIKIKRIEDDKTTHYYKNIKDAASDVDTTFDNWKVQMLIQQALNSKKKAFHSHWEVVINEN